jgi:hypothetical protein
MARKLHDLRKETDLDRGPLLRKFWNVAHRLRSLPEHMVSRVLYFQRRDLISCGKSGRAEREGDRRRPRPSDFDLGKEEAKRQKQLPLGSPG